jgi:ketosteroid isomerase-like protein
MSTATVKGEHRKDEADIRALIETIDKAHHNKDAAAIVAPYAQDAVVCDLAPPLSHRGMNLQAKQAWLDTWEGPIDRESRDFNITVSGDFAFCHGFYRLAGTPKGGGPADQFLDARNCVPASGGKRLADRPTRPYPFTWMAACGPHLISSPKLTHQFRGWGAQMHLVVRS